MKALSKITQLVFLLSFTACAKMAPVADLSQTVSSSLGCSSFRSHVFDTMYDILDQNRTTPTQQEFKKSLEGKVSSHALVEEVTHLYGLLNEEVKSFPQITSTRAHLNFLIQVEFGNVSTPENQKISSETKASFERIQKLTDELQIACTAPATNPDTTPTPTTNSSMPAALLGGHLAFATAYQSCDVLDLPVMTKDTPNVVGVGIGPNIGGGYQRFYKSISDIQATHYYIKNISYQNGCIAVKDKPLVYDYGGSPLVSNNALNFFVNAGTGGTALGMDCSAFISSAIAAAGLRYSPGVTNKSIFIRQSSENFIEPAASGWKCFDRVAFSPTETIHPGDIMGIVGHVVMIDKVGHDPFGLASIKTISECSSITPANFDFSVLQSSPSKSSIGINRYIASDYLPEDTLMQDAFLAYAKSACTAKLSGQANLVSNTQFGLIRHKGTPECLAAKVPLQGQSCVSSCREFQ